jgi:thiol-disulfide isomerase/thioredoxin
MVAPLFTQLAEELPEVTFETVDVETDGAQTTEFNVRTVPTVIVLDNGVVKHTIVGANAKKRYLDAITAP